MPRNAQHPGQGILELEGSPDSIILEEQFRPSIDLGHRIAISGLIKLASEQLDFDASEVSERDKKVMSPNVVASGLYVPVDKHDQDVAGAYGGVIFPSEQFLLIARSPRDLAKHMVTRTTKAHNEDSDKRVTGETADRSGIHILEDFQEKGQILLGNLKKEEKYLRSFSRELRGANNTGWYAHYNADNLLILKTNAETAIFNALRVTATTHQWDTDILDRATQALKYQLYGADVKRIQNWIGHTNVAGNYVVARRQLVSQALRKTSNELERRSTRTVKKNDQ